MIKRMELYFKDLNQETKTKVLEFFEAESPEELNAEITPIAVMEIDMEDRDFEE